MRHTLTSSERAYVLTHAPRSQSRSNATDWAMTLVVLCLVVTRFLSTNRVVQFAAIIAACAVALLFIIRLMITAIRRRKAHRGELGEMALRLEIDFQTMLSDLSIAIGQRKDMTFSYLGNVRFPRRRHPKETNISFPSELIPSYRPPVIRQLETIRTIPKSIEQ